MNDEAFRLGDASKLTEAAEGLEDVKAAVEKTKESRESLFSYAVLSGETDAVQLVHDLVVNLFGGKNRDVSVDHAYARTHETESYNALLCLLMGMAVMDILRSICFPCS